MKVTYTCTLPAGTSHVVAPGGLNTPHGHCIDFSATGGTVRDVIEGTTGQTAKLITPAADKMSLIWTFDEGHSSAYPEEMFQHRPSRFTRFADDLVTEAEDAAGDLTGLARARAIACAAAERFTYGHPEDTFNDGLEEVPALGCGIVEGSCVDINTYFIAALRAAGVEAGYATGFYFPAEKGDHCTDGHCWVVTRIDGQTQEWDIAHHIKTGTRDIHPGLNPKPGRRAACFHSMGLAFPEFGVEGIKALIEPAAITPGGAVRFTAPEIRLKDVAAATTS